MILSGGPKVVMRDIAAKTSEDSCRIPNHILITSQTSTGLSGGLILSLRELALRPEIWSHNLGINVQLQSYGGGAVWWICKLKQSKGIMTPIWKWIDITCWRSSKYILYSLTMILFHPTDGQSEYKRIRSAHGPRGRLTITYKIQSTYNTAR